jgi:hypothetical protein
LIKFHLDTDSIIFSHPRGVEPIKDGKYLGEMSQEYKNFEIVECCSGGVLTINMEVL